MTFFNYETLINNSINKMESYDYLKKFNLLEVASAKKFENIEENSFDIFLSHSYKDKMIIPALKQELENLGYSVYVDWINDKLLSRGNVNINTARILQLRMQQSKVLFFATSDNSNKSTWMPWELGYFDGIKNKRVAILPIKNNTNNFNENFNGQEYLSLYYYVSIDKLSRVFEHEPMSIEPNAFEELRKKFNKIDKIFVNKSPSKFVEFEEWIKGEEPYTLEDACEKISKLVNK